MLSVYKASAGSGKTFTLTREYIKLLLGEKDPETGRYRLSHERGRHRHTLAITFTNKATEEMKRRIIHQLAVLGGVEPGWSGKSPYEKDLLDEFVCSPQQLHEAARGALKSLLLGFNNFNVSTIDSFFQLVLRAFAREAELTGNYEVELDDKSVLNRAVGSLLSSLKTDRDPAANRRLVNWLSQLMISRIEEGHSYNVFNRNLSVFADVVGFISSISGEAFAQRRDEMMDYLADDTRLADFQADVSQALGSFYPEASKACMALARHIDENGYGSCVKVALLNICEKWSGTAAPADLSTGSFVPKALADPSYAFKKNSDPGDSRLYMLIENACGKISDCAAYTAIYKAIRKNIYMLGLLHRTTDLANEQLVDDNRLMLSDTNYLLSRIIGDGDAPFVYERVGVNLQHFLIDEFQDTSKLQWQNLRILLEEGLSQGHDSLIIGDEKQCIYRFRNSDPSLLQYRLKLDLPQHCDEHGSDQRDNINWRSSADVIRFNNALFGKLADTLGFPDVYANVAQGIPESHSDFKGYVSVSYADSAEASLDNMLTHIRRQLESGYSPGDIAVLVRRVSEGAEVVEYLLGAHSRDPECPQLRVVSDDSVGVGSSPAVRLIVSVLRVMSTADRSGGERSMSRRRLACMLHEYEGMLNRGMTRSDAMRDLLASCKPDDDDDAAADPLPVISPNRCANLISMVEEIIATLVPMSARTAENVFLSTFQDMVLDFNRRGDADISSFIRWWDTRGHSTKVTLPADPEAIRVMTIHKSKGLEFECVHIPFATWPLFSPKSPEWFDLKGLPMLNPSNLPPIFPIVPMSAMESTPLAEAYRQLRNESVLDELNVAYVAFTRAVSELVAGISKSTGDNLGSRIADALSLSTGDTFTSGVPTAPRPAKTESRPALEARQPVEMPEYRTFAHSRLWDSTRLEEEEELSVQRKRGLRLHNLLARVRRFEDIPADDEGEKLRHMIAGHGVERWFAGFSRVLCEREIVSASGKTMRPDRVVWLGDGTVEVIDYKTGEENDTRYRHQVGRYISLLKSLGHNKVRGYVWYLDTDRVTEVGRR